MDQNHIVASSPMVSDRFKEFIVFHIGSEQCRRCLYLDFHLTAQFYSKLHLLGHGAVDAVFSREDSYSTGSLILPSPSSPKSAVASVIHPGKVRGCYSLVSKAARWNPGVKETPLIVLRIASNLWEPEGLAHCCASLTNPRNVGLWAA